MRRKVLAIFAATDDVLDLRDTGRTDERRRDKAYRRRMSVVVVDGRGGTDASAGSRSPA